MTRPRTILVTDGGEDLWEHGDYVEEYGDEYVEYYPDGFVSGEPVPEPIDHYDDFAGEYYTDPHLVPGHDVDPDPPWGYEDGSARPRGPPCRDCGEDTTAESFGWSPDTGETVDWAVCKDCNLGWGPVTEWVDLDDDDSELRTDGGQETPPSQWWQWRRTEGVERP